jgi:hypothetical protein
MKGAVSKTSCVSLTTTSTTFVNPKYPHILNVANMCVEPIGTGDKPACLRQAELEQQNSHTRPLKLLG